MNVSYSMVIRHYSDASSTALRQHGGHQNRPTPLDQDPLNSKAMSGAVSNGSQLKILLNLDLIRCVIRNIPKRERSKSDDKGKWPFFSRLIGGVAWSSLWSISAGLRMAVLWSTDEVRPWAIG